MLEYFDSGLIVKVYVSGGKGADENVRVPLRLFKAGHGNVWVDDRRRNIQETARFVMLDVIFVAATIVFFGVAVLYVRGCERLK